MTRPKNQPAKKAGRPLAGVLTDYQRELKNKILKHTLPLFEAMLNKQAELAGVKLQDQTSLDITKDNKTKGESVSPSVQLSAVTSFIKLHVDTIKAVYGVDKEGMISNLPDEEDDIQKPTATVSRLSLTVVPQSTDKS